METTTANTCPHCGGKLLRWENPDFGSWDSPYQWVCFNDECPYFVRGWNWMTEHYNVHASYRFRLDPRTGETGPLPVWSARALRERITLAENGEGASAG